MRIRSRDKRVTTGTGSRIRPVAEAVADFAAVGCRDESQGPPSLAQLPLAQLPLALLLPLLPPGASRETDCQLHRSCSKHGSSRRHWAR